MFYILNLFEEIMLTLKQEISEKIHSLPAVYLKEALDFIEFLNQKYNKINDTEFLSSIHGMSESIEEGRREKIEDCKTLKDNG